MDFETYNGHVEEHNKQSRELQDTECVRLYYQIRDDEKNPIRSSFYRIINEGETRSVVESSAQRYRLFAGNNSETEKSAATVFANVLKPIFRQIVNQGTVTLDQLLQFAKNTNDQKRSA